jgi:prevent-host-death family protein
MLIEPKQMISITRLQKELTQIVRKLENTGEAVFILKNNRVTGALISYAEYERLKSLDRSAPPSSSGLLRKITGQQSGGK